MTVEEMKACIIAYEEAYQAKKRAYAKTPEAKAKARAYANTPARKASKAAWRINHPYGDFLNGTRSYLVKKFGISRSDVPAGLAEALTLQTLIKREIKKVVDTA